MEPPFEALEGVTSVVSGFMGGNTPNPSYDDVAAGKTGHAEVVQVSYVASRVRYQDLLEVFWKNIDPTAKDRQFCDVGRQYRIAIIFVSKEQERLAQQSLEKLRKSGRFKTIHTELAPGSTFYPAGPEHQDFYRTNAARYKQYRQGCGRDQRLVEIWAGFSKIFGK
jgi:peptide-methionine (S)-S-oxide reductase